MLVTTERDKDETRASWAARGRCVDEFNDQWNTWERYIKPRAFVLSFERRDSLAELGEVLGVEFKTNWEPVNERKDKQTEIQRNHEPKEQG